MRTYSPRSKELARELRDKAIRNLERSGRTVVRDAKSGRYEGRGEERRVSGSPDRHSR